MHSKRNFRLLKPKASGKYQCYQTVLNGINYYFYVLPNMIPIIAKH